ncbi:sensor histidine kinase [Clostridioides difficile]|uniref:sensor histidine kinase n=1 Tax=Clostridioides difficile TaxID=1496 RepID=UPI000BB18EC2|nr:HAMP domain-containing sensor histidine kinase [Clostridioides difficile]PBI40108.1 two-component sensor histidine kinase [Clostridioides difficile]
MGSEIYFRGLTYSGIDSEINDELEYIVSQFKRTSFLNPIRLKNPKDLVYVYEDGRISYYTQNEYFDELLPDRRLDKKNSFFKYTENGYTFRELNVDVGRYQIQIIRNIDSEMNSLRQLTSVLIIGILISVIITYFVAVYLTRKALIPIETAWKNQAKFIQDASHELRTPITIVSSKLESMLKSPESTVNDEVETIATAMKETRRLKKMITDLLSLTKEDSIVKVNLEEIDLEKLLEEISEDYIDIAEFQEKKFVFNSKLKNKVIITDKNKLRQLILIFIDNAFKYTKSGDEIVLELREDIEDEVILLISDTGIGIKKEEIPLIFDRFFRSENVRNKDLEGSGIGLSIARMISLNLSIEINVTSDIDIGTTFELSIPKKLK